MLLRGTAIVSLLTLLSRVLGFVRDLLVARLLGASLFADAFFVAFRVPNLLRSFAAEGALTSAFVPVFSSALARSKEDARTAFKRVAGFVLYLTILLALVGIVFAQEILSLIAPGFEDDPEKLALTVRLTQIMFPYIVCVSLVAMLNSALNTLKAFGASAWAQVIMNIILIVGALCALPFDPKTATTILAVSVVVGGVIQVIAQIPACRKAGLPTRASSELRSREVREVVRLMLPATVGASVYQVNIFISTLLASLLAEGSISWLFYADRVAQFPVGIFTVALASVLLPMLANASASANAETFRSGLADSLRFTSFAILPMAGGIWVLATPLTTLLFERGAFSHYSTLMTAAAIRALALGLWASSCYSMVMRAFIAKKDTVTPTLIGLGSLIVYLVAALILMGPVPPSQDFIISAIAQAQSSVAILAPTVAAQGHVGLALASSIGAIASLSFAIGVYTLRLGSFPWASFTRSFLHASVGTIGMIGAVSACTPFEAPPFIACACGAMIGVGTYVALGIVLRSHEMRDTLTLIKRKLKKA
jgi:putative peptidoglycan lipid II flippase